MRELKYREVKSFVQDHTDSKWGDEAQTVVILFQSPCSLCLCYIAKYHIEFITYSVEFLTDSTCSKMNHTSLALSLREL